MELSEIDLNLLVVFHKLLTERQVSKAAESLGVSQPAVSSALKRLRKILGDDLFLRTSRGMEPTPFALQLVEPLVYGLNSIHSALNLDVIFDPTTSTRDFTIAMTDIGEIYILPRLMRVLSEHAPGVTIGTVRHSTPTLQTDMETGKIDLTIGLINSFPAGFFQRRVLQQGYVCMFRSGHPLDKATFTLEDFLAADHVVVTTAGTGHIKVDDLLERAGIQRNIRLRIPHYVTLNHLLQNSDMVATVPKSLALPAIAPFNLKYVPHPVALPQMAVNMFWHSKFHRDPGNQWLRKMIHDHCSAPPT
jgi:DNA-binding transcriptional LysR family regulator